MMDAFSDIRFEVFSTCPQSSAVAAADYVEQVQAVARWSEEAGCKGILVYTENSLVDPWLVSQIILQSTKELCPLVAVQPVYMHPYSIAKMVSSLAHMYGRRLYLNMVAGGYTTELTALGDTTAHDKRYARLIEYTGIIKRLLENAEPVTLEGQFNAVRNLRMTPPLPPELLPGVFVSGSSEAGLAAAKALGATPVRYPKPAAEYGPADTADCTGSGVRVGVIARPSADEAWRVAHERFPTDKKGQLAHKLAMKVSDSAWHKQMSDLAAQTAVTQDTPYWLVPFENYKTFCPYLVGNYRVVSDELARYAAAGYGTFILDIPPTREELIHTGEVFGLALTKARRLKSSALRDPARQGLGG
ncbi:LLM class flavin-dependent oxidoreductase [Bradyrhizobium elkanii]|jgi:alkanesulfonate monooxygenase|uniref:LLM class flavin-dependent oxidoreductase n=2 Tax=Nitrobacteraceae TaxID=41294 RepID=UPI0007C51987|nr:LLM class flavin-dependent oxidoreductase [Bradyrhizobium elkanii]MCS3447773.1 alkanesulfonate monooxygenase [Bradyrhizobium elkanii]WLB02764.1 LLM class flavin-dependent oxidoreductase [Bradyrhizobium elkanii]WLC05623.1 LLM class flavin-dependent oxidoreductase [Bradyrhizobium elkanii USDA 94]